MKPTSNIKLINTKLEQTNLAMQVLEVPIITRHTIKIFLQQYQKKTLNQLLYEIA